MRTTSFFARVGVAAGGMLGALALSAFAATTWTAPASTPPSGNVDAPLNIGSTIQTKSGGSIQINGGFGIAGGPFVYRPTTAPAIGQVLTAADTSGKIVWANSASNVTSGGSASNYYFQLGTGLLIQGGITYPGTQQKITTTFARPFTSVISVQLTSLDNRSQNQQVHPEDNVKVFNITNTSFEGRTTNNNGFSWMAIGLP